MLSGDFSNSQEMDKKKDTFGVSFFDFSTAVAMLALSLKKEKESMKKLVHGEVHQLILNYKQCRQPPMTGRRTIS